METTIIEQMDAEKLRKAQWRLRYALSNYWGYSIMINGKSKPHFERINAYTQKYWHKLIDDMTYDECLAKAAAVYKSKKAPKDKYQ